MSDNQIQFRECLNNYDWQSMEKIKKCCLSSTILSSLQKQKNKKYEKGINYYIKIHTLKI